MNHTEQRLLEIGMKNMPFSLHTKPERLETDIYPSTQKNLVWSLVIDWPSAVG